MTRLYGYAGKILRVDLSSGSMADVPTMDYADKFLGGLGVAIKIYWDEVLPEVGAFDPESRLMFMNGPLAGFPGLAGSRWTISGKTPNTNPEQFGWCNLGGGWGAQLKFAGFDGIVVQGKADSPVYLFVGDGTAEIRDASNLWGKGAKQTRRMLKEELGDTVSVAACSTAGENGVVFACVVGDNDAVGSSGFGAVMGSKNLKAIAVSGVSGIELGSKKNPCWGCIGACYHKTGGVGVETECDDPAALPEVFHFLRCKPLQRSHKVTAADPKRLRELRRYIRYLWMGAEPIMDKRSMMGPRRKDLCYGCVGNCSRTQRQTTDGTVLHRNFCGPPAVFHIFASMHYPDMKEMPAFDVPMKASELVDDLGLDVLSVANLLAWIGFGAQTGLFTEENTGLPLRTFGSWEFLEAALKMMASREDFGDVLAQGIWKAAETFGEGAKQMLAQLPFTLGSDGRVVSYCPRAFPGHALIYALEPSYRIQQLHEMAFPHFRWLHQADRAYSQDGFAAASDASSLTTEAYVGIARRFWGGEAAADFSSYDGKALAIKMVQERAYVKESLGLCDFLWPISSTCQGDHVGDPSVESKVFSAITGREIDEDGLYRMGERIFNLRRAITIRERGGRESDLLPESMFTVSLNEGVNNPRCLVPGKGGETISLSGAVVAREGFEGLKDEYYRIRGWEVSSGIPTEAKLNELGLEDVIPGLEGRGFAIQAR